MLLAVFTVAFLFVLDASETPRGGTWRWPPRT